MTRLYIFALLVLTSFGSALAQYQFENKKAEKLYEKLKLSFVCRLWAVSLCDKLRYIEQFFLTFFDNRESAVCCINCCSGGNFVQWIIS